MPDKKRYDVTERFKEVARRAAQSNANQKLQQPLVASSIEANEKATADSRPGRSMNIPRGKYGEKKDVNLPIQTASPELRKSIAQQVYEAGEEERKKNPRFKNFGLVKRR